MYKVVKYNTENTITSWAVTNLSPTDLDDYLQALEENTQRYENFKAANGIYEEEYFKNVYVNSLKANIEVKIGTILTLPDPNILNSFSLSPRFDYWEKKYQSSKITE